MRVDIVATGKKKEYGHLVRHQQLMALKGMTPKEASDWVEANVTTLAKAKTVIAALAAAVTYLLRNSPEHKADNAK
jgi:hypothetical protein